MNRWRDQRRGDRGSVTAELALALPSLILVLAVGLWLQSAVALKARCLDAARAGARAAARGDSDALIRRALAADLPSAAGVSISRSGRQVTILITARADPPAGISALVSGPVLRATATGQAEP